MIYFTSDTHYWHRNIIEYSKRPFRDLDEMHEEMIRRWNERVGPDDSVVHLGDFSFGTFEQGRSILERLNGIIWLVRGNHDRSAKRMSEMGFHAVTDELSWDPRIALGCSDSGAPLRVVMRHHPPTDAKHPRPDWRTTGDVFLCGHVHEHWRRRGDVINVGVDASDFRPLTLAELLVRDLPPSVPVATLENPG